MSDELLEAVGGVAREETEMDPRLDALVEGRLSPGELAALEAEAETNPELAQALLLFRPLEDDARGRMAARITASQTGESAPAADAPAKVIPLFGRWQVWSGLTALAAALLLFALQLDPFTAAPLPRYTMELTGGDRQLRAPTAPPSEVATLRPSSQIEVILRPASPAGGRVAATAFIVRGQDVRTLDLPLQISADGAVRYAGSAGEILSGPSGEVVIGFLVGTAGALPAPDVAWRGRAESPADRAWQVSFTRVHFIASTD